MSIDYQYQDISSYEGYFDENLSDVFVARLKPNGIIDGDTIDVIKTSDNSTVRIRFSGIDAPEKETQLGKSARARLGILIKEGEDLYIKTSGLGVYGRTLGTILVKPLSSHESRPSNNFIANEVMLRMGWAQTFIMNEVFAPFVGLLQEAQTFAMKKSFGIWKKKNTAEIVVSTRKEESISLEDVDRDSPGFTLINGHIFNVPPTQITVQRNTFNYQWDALRKRNNLVAKSGHGSINILFSVFVLPHEHKTLANLLSELRASPFLVVDNTFLREEIEAGGSSIPLFALLNLDLATTPQHPGSIVCNFHCTWVNPASFAYPLQFSKLNLSDPENPRIEPTPYIEESNLWKLFQILNKSKYEGPRDEKELGLGYKQFKSLFLDEEETPRRVLVSDEENNPYGNSIQAVLKEMNKIIRKETDRSWTDQDRFKKLTNLKNKLIDFESRRDQTNPQLTKSFEEYLKGRNQTELVKIVSPSSINAEISRKNLENLKKAFKDYVNIRKNSSNNRTQITATTLPGVGDLRFFSFIENKAKQTRGFEGYEFTGLTFDRRLQQKRLNSEYPMEKKITEAIFYKPRIINLYRESFGDASNFIPETVQLHISNNMAMLPLVGQSFPTYQHLGSNNVEIKISLKILSEEGKRKLQEMLSITESNARLLRYIVGGPNISVENELTNLLGTKEFVVNSLDISSIPGSPGTYNASLQLLESSHTLEDYEKIKPRRRRFNYVAARPIILTGLEKIISMSLKTGETPSQRLDGARRELQKAYVKVLNKIFDNNFDLTKITDYSSTTISEEIGILPFIEYPNKSEYLKAFEDGLTNTPYEALIRESSLYKNFQEGIRKSFHKVSFSPKNFSTNKPSFLDEIKQYGKSLSDNFQYIIAFLDDAADKYFSDFVEEDNLFQGVKSTKPEQVPFYSAYPDLNLDNLLSSNIVFEIQNSNGEEDTISILDILKKNPNLKKFLYSPSFYFYEREGVSLAVPKSDRDRRLKQWAEQVYSNLSKIEEQREKKLKEYLERHDIEF